MPRAKLPSLKKRKWPLRFPFFVRHIDGIMLSALLCVLPVGCVSTVYIVDRFPRSHTNGFVPILATLLCFISGVLYTNEIIVSKWLLGVVRWYLDHDEVEEACTVATDYARRIKYRDFRRNEWFQSFITAHHLEKIGFTYETYFYRLNKSQ